MIKNYFIVSKEEMIESIIQKIVLNAHRTVLVVEKKKVIGLISEGDILKSLIYKKNMNATASSMMNKSFKFLLKKILPNPVIELNTNFIPQKFEINVPYKTLLIVK